MAIKRMSSWNGRTSGISRLRLKPRRKSLA